MTLFYKTRNPRKHKTGKVYRAHLKDLLVDKADLYDIGRLFFSIFRDYGFNRGISVE